MEASPESPGTSEHVKCKGTKYGSTDIHSKSGEDGGHPSFTKSEDGGHPDDYDRRKQARVRKQGKHIDIAEFIYTFYNIARILRMFLNGCGTASS